MSLGVIASSYITGGGGNPTGDSPYANAVLSDGPLLYLPLNETSGSTAADISGNGRDGSYANITLDNYGLIANGGSRSVRVDANNGSSTITVPYGGWMNTGELTVLIPCLVPSAVNSIIAGRYVSDPASSDDSWFVGCSGSSFVLLGWRKIYHVINTIL
jgi:hypothetical protein